MDTLATVLIRLLIWVARRKFPGTTLNYRILWLQSVAERVEREGEDDDESRRVV